MRTMTYTSRGDGGDGLKPTVFVVVLMMKGVEVLIFVLMMVK